MKVHLAITFALALSLPVSADPQTDAEFIAGQTTTRAIFEGVIAAQRQVLISAIENDLRQRGIDLPDPERFFDVFLDVWIDEFTHSMQGQTADIYLQVFDEKELAGIAAFMRTPSGAAFVAASPELMMEGARLGERAGIEAAMRVGPVLADRLESEELVEDRTLLRRLQDALR